MAILEYRNGLGHSGYDNSVGLFFNLGNAYYKNDELGKAILYYEKAARISPFSKDIQFNLELAKESIQGDVSPLPKFFLFSWFDSLSRILNSRLWALISILFVSLGFYLLFRWSVAKTRKTKGLSFMGGIMVLLISILPISLALNSAQMESDDSLAILISDKTPLLNAPDGTTQFEIFEGTELRIRDRIGEWIKVGLVNGDEGWVKETEVSRV